MSDPRFCVGDDESRMYIVRELVDMGLTQEQAEKAEKELSGKDVITQEDLEQAVAKYKGQ